MTHVSTCSARAGGLGWAEIDLPLVAELEDRIVLALPSGDTVEVGTCRCPHGTAVNALTIDGRTYRITVMN